MTLINVLDWSATTGWGYWGKGGKGGGDQLLNAMIQLLIPPPFVIVCVLPSPKIWQPTNVWVFSVKADTPLIRAIPRKLRSHPTATPCRNVRNSKFQVTVNNHVERHILGHGKCVGLFKKGQINLTSKRGHISGETKHLKLGLNCGRSDQKLLHLVRSKSFLRSMVQVQQHY